MLTSATAVRGYVTSTALRGGASHRGAEGDTGQESVDNDATLAATRAPQCKALQCARMTGIKASDMPPCGASATRIQGTGEFPRHLRLWEGSTVVGRGQTPAPPPVAS